MPISSFFVWPLENCPSFTRNKMGVSVFLLHSMEMDSKIRQQSSSSRSFISSQEGVNFQWASLPPLSMFLVLSKDGLHCPPPL
ncbi:hypothetical protein C1H46_012114 [Malus baccata]|uniref:Uncharacterized protein n=1 Tax=Malus baccata TaxID=106549 RepID=A0A540MVH6_MALBA|nr:hypothetical protein C1H46_012114 [Malus baccata]